MKMPSYKEVQALADATVIATAKRKELLSKNKEAARALLSAIQSPQVSTVVKIIPKENVDS
jgi:hypothetical protein